MGTSAQECGPWNISARITSGLIAGVSPNQEYLDVCQVKVILPTKFLKLLQNGNHLLQQVARASVSNRENPHTRSIL
jgi:hypothetical protein